jgi:hypothetical protein
MIVKINKGRHSFFKLPRFFFKRNIELKFTLIGDFSYNTDDITNQSDTNKIFGISDAIYHRNNSIRIGFRYYKDKLELVGYYYNNGIHYTEKISNIKENTNYNIKINILDKNYQIIFDDKSYLYPRTSKWSFIRYLLFPYFGGQESAKKDLVFKLEWK